MGYVKLGYETLEALKFSVETFLRVQLATSSQGMDVAVERFVRRYGCFLRK